MDDFESKINQILSDPERMSQIMSMASQLGGNSEPQEQPKESVPFPIDGESMQKIMSLFSEINNKGSKEAALFQALKPFVSPAHRERMDKAAQIARISHAASSVLNHSNMK